MDDWKIVLHVPIVRLQEALVTYERLRLAREEKGWTIEDLARRAGMRPRTIDLIDRGEFGELPPGLYGRASIRSYATAVGLDATEMVEVLRPMLQSEGDPLGALARRCGHTLKAQARSAPPEPRAAAQCVTATAVMERPLAAAAPAARPASVVPVESAPILAEPAAVARAAMEDVAQAIAPPPVAVMQADDRLHPADPSSDSDFSDVVLVQSVQAPWVEPEMEPHMTLEASHSTEAGRQWWRPVAASAIDSAFLVGIGSGLVWLTALVGATTVPVVLRSAAPGIAVVFTLIVSLYFVLFGGLGNGTPGGSLMRLEARPSGRTVLNPREVFGRACRSIYRDDTLVAD